MIVLMVSCGVHRGLLQSFAWSQMLITYSQFTGSIEEGVQKTFDGQNPCQMCLEIAKAGMEDQKKEKKPHAPTSPVLEWSIILPVSTLGVYPPMGKKLKISRVIQSPLEISFALELPPPKAIKVA